MHSLGLSRTYAGDEPYEPFLITDEERLRHIWCCGKSGMGKSTFLENQAIRSMLDGEGLVFIDPHGASVENIKVPPERRKDVHWFAPHAQRDFPQGFNPLYCTDPAERADIAARALECLYALFHDSWGPQLEMICGNALLAVLCVPDGTLMSVKFMITSQSYRERVLTHVGDLFLKQYWQGDFLDMPDKEQRERVLSTLNKVTKFLSDPMLRSIIAQPVTSFSFEEIIATRRFSLPTCPALVCGAVRFLEAFSLAHSIQRH